MLENYLKIALRNLKRNKAYALLNIGGLGAGMTGAILIFLFIQHHVKTDRHQPGFDRTYRVVLDLLLDEGTEKGTDASYPMANALSKEYAQVEEVGFISRLPQATISTQDGHNLRRFVEKGNVVFASQGFMNMFSVNWLLKSNAEMLNEPNSVVINERTAQKYFSTTDALGKTLKLDNTVSLTVTGIIRDDERPSDLRFDVFISLPTMKVVDPAFEPDNFHWLSSRNAIFVRLPEHADPAVTEARIKANGVKYYGDVAKYYLHKLQPLSEVHFDENYDGKIKRTILGILAAVGGFLLLIAGINFVNMATAHALRRSKEIGIRKALGSSRAQLFWQFMNETALLTLGASVLALIAVALLLPLLNTWANTRAFHFGLLLNPEFLVFWLLSAVFVIAVAGFYPAVIVSGFNPLVALKSKAGVLKSGGIGLRRSLIGVQLVIAQVLIIGTLVLMLQLRFFQDKDPGFDKASVAIVPLPEERLNYGMKKTFKDELSDYHDIEAVTYQYEAPTSSMGYGGSVRFDNRPNWEKFMIRDRFGDEDYLETYKIPLLAGRDFKVREGITEFVVNEELMKKVGVRNPQDMIGKQLEDGNSGFKGEIVGVVKSFHLKSLHESKEPCAIFSHPRLYKEVAIRLKTGNIEASLENIKKVWEKNYPDEVYSFQFVDERISKFYEKENQLTALIRSFSILAILICCLGLYGMVSFMVTQKTREVGIRKVLGAGVYSIMVLFGKEFLTLVAVAFVVAAPIAWSLMNTWLNGFAYRIEFAWWILAAGGLSTMAITLLTVGYKVVKAALMDPVKSIGTD